MSHVCDDYCPTLDCQVCGDDICMDAPDVTTHEMSARHCSECWSGCGDCIRDAANEEAANALFLARGGVER